MSNLAGWIGNQQLLHSRFSIHQSDARRRLSQGESKDGIEGVKVKHRPAHRPASHRYPGRRQTGEGTPDGPCDSGAVSRLPIVFRPAFFTSLPKWRECSLP